MNKTNFKIAFIIIGILVIAAIVVTVIVQKNTSNPKIDKNSVISLEPKINEKVFFPQYIGEKKSIGFLGDQGIKFKKISLDDQKLVYLNNQEFLFITNMIFSPNGDKATFSTRDGNNDKIAFKTIDFSTGKIFTLEDNISDISWLNNEKIIYSITTQSTDSIETALYNGEKNEKIIDVPTFSTVIKLSNNKNQLIFYSEPQGYGKNKLYKLSLETKQYSELTSKYLLVDAKWSPNDQKIISENYNTEGNIISLVTTNIDTNKQQEIKTTSNLDQTVWIDDEFIVAAAEVVSANTQLDLIKTSNSKITPFYSKFDNSEPTKTLSIKNLMLIDKTLYFTLNDFLYKLPLF